VNKTGVVGLHLVNYETSEELAQIRMYAQLNPDCRF